MIYEIYSTQFPEGLSEASFMLIGLPTGSLMIRLFVLGVAMASASMSGLLVAASSNLSLRVGGAVGNAPQWYDLRGEPLTSIAFAFPVMGAGVAAGPLLESDRLGVGVYVASGSSIDVSFIAPADCSIGGMAIANSEIALLVDGEPTAPSKFFSFSGSTLRWLVLQFRMDPASNGIQGEVRCGSGLMMVSY